MDGIIDSLREGLGINSSTQSVANNSAANNLSRNNSAANNLSRNNSAANNLSRNNSVMNNTATRISASNNSTVSRRNRDTLPSLKKTVPVGSALLSKPLKNSTMTGGSRRRRRRTRKNKYRVIR